MRNIGKLLSYLFSFGLLGALIFGLWHRQSIADWYRLRDYQPSSEIVALADNTQMTDYGRKLFYVHNPQLEDAENFNQHCDIEEQTIVLGCYITHRSIHVFDVEDERLQGIREVTAAHEMLHAAYDRLDDTERKQVDYWTVTFYDSIKRDNERLRQVVEAYAKRDLSVVNNELHSILATEVEDLSEELEAYYSRYFSDRSAVVAYSDQYEDVFVQQQQKIQSLRTEITQLEEDLKNRRVQIDATQEELQAEAERLSDLRSSDQIEAYNAAVPGYNQQVNQYRSTVENFNNDVQRLNNLIAQYNDLAVQQKELYNAIDSKQAEL